MLAELGSPDFGPGDIIHCKTLFTATRPVRQCSLQPYSGGLYDAIQRLG